MSTAYSIFFNEDGSYKTSAQYLAEAEAELPSLDLMTTRQLCDYQDNLFAEHTRRYDRVIALHTLDPAYRTAKAAMDEIGEQLHAVWTAIKTRTQETADA